MTVYRSMVNFQHNSTPDSKQSPTVASAMTQPARRTFLPGHVVVIICSITIQLLNLTRTIHLERYERSYNKITSFAFLGLLFLSYPLLGYIADVCLTRYRTLKCSFLFLISWMRYWILTNVTIILLFGKSGSEIFVGKIHIEYTNSIHTCRKQLLTDNL